MARRSSRGRPRPPTPGLRPGGFQPDRIEHVDQLLELGGERIDLFAQEGE
jgi:hypothetical protein